MAKKDKSIGTYKVLSPIKVDPNSRDMLQPGDTAEFPADQAAELIACGALQAPDAGDAPAQ